MKALVTGGNGFIGSHLVDDLVQRGWEVVVLDLSERRYDPIPSRARFIPGSLNDTGRVIDALIGVDVVFHLSWSTIHEISNQDPAADVTTNLVPTIHLLEACRHAEVGRVVFTSSGGTVYGPAIEWPITETHPLNPINGYGVTKLAVEKYLQMFKHLYGLDYVVLRPSVPYGPRQNPLARQGAVAVFLNRVARGLPVTIFGDGSNTRDFFYVSDLVDALIAGAERKLYEHRIFNLGGVEEVSLIQLLKLIENVVGKTARVQYAPARQFDAQRIVLNTGLARQELGWHAKVSLADGLAKTWTWMSTINQ
jgi:UDP-glucose 4-epimerase